MTSESVIETFKKSGALLEGHFLYASGRHGRHFLQASRVLQFPQYTEPLCAAMAERFKNDRIEIVVGPATGGIILAYETARHLGCRAAFSEKESDGSFAVKRGFAIPPGIRTLVVEDIITTGGSVAKTVTHLRLRGAEVVGAAVLIDRSGGKTSLDCRLESLATFTLESWPADGCTLCAAGAPLLDPDDIVL